MKRREFMTLLGGAAAAGPRAASAQQADRLPTIGILGSASAGWNHWLGAFIRRLGELGWIENRTISIDYRWSEGRSERYAEFGAEFARRKIDVIVPLGTPGPSSPRKRRLPSSPSYSRLLPTRSAKAWSPRLRTPGATSPDSRTSSPILPASDSKFCATFFPGSDNWGSSAMPAIAPPRCRWRK